MIRIKLITTAVAAALYSAGTAYASGLAIPGQQVQHQLQQPKLDMQKIYQYSDQARQRYDSMAQNDGLNVQINRQHGKFTAEDGIRGEHVYIVRLTKPALSNASFSDATLAQISNNKQKLFRAGKAVTSEVVQYRQQLLQQQHDFVQQATGLVGQLNVRRQFTNAINGMTVTMTQEQAAQLASLPQVQSVQRSKLYELLTDAGPELIKADTLWTGTADATVGVPYKGEGIIVGIVDTGINTDHPSFAAIAEDGYSHTNPWGAGNYVGDCQKAGFENLCNDKLIGVRSYSVITDKFTSGELGAVRAAVGEDYQGHGSHVASTAAGNPLSNVDFVTSQSASAGDGEVVLQGMFPRISGVAPRANIISYQVCYPAAEEVTGCPGEALIAGIEDAISDGVDVINFSIGGQDSHPWSDAVEMAFLNAREAGIMVAAAAGNSGQANGAAEFFGAIDHASPWLMNVAATTHGREVVVETLLADPQFVDPATAGSKLPGWSSLAGGSITTEAVTGVVLRAADYNNVNGVKDQYCGSAYAPGTFDNYPDGSPVVDGNGNPVDTLVVCARDNLANANGVARTLKADNVKAGGADGFIMYNFASADPIVYTAKYSLPSIHLSYGDWFGHVSNGSYGLEDWTRSTNGRGHLITIEPTVIERRVDDANADWLAPFSSRGPSPSTPEALIPAVAAPGVSIYAAYADEKPFTDSPATADFNFLSGTSMASPHVAGAMALLHQAHPEWTPAEVQSALAMTADNVVKYRRLNSATGDVELASTYRAGTGRINVENAVNAGLVLDETADNFRAADPLNGGAVHKLNLPQLVNFSCKPSCTWLRTVKATKDGNWSVTSDDVMNWSYDSRSQSKQNGVTIDVSPSEFTLAAGETQVLVVKASVMDTQDWFSNAEVELHSQLVFTEQSGTSPQAHWPMVFKYDMNNMPARLEAIAHANNASAVFKGVELPEGNHHGRVFTPVKADVIEVTLPKDDDGTFPWSSNMDLSVDVTERLDEATVSHFVTVPQGAKRLIAETIGKTISPLVDSFDIGNLNVYVGKDYNGNGLPDMNDEILCVSNHISYNNFCNINNPEAGDYWVVLYNSRQGSAQNNYYDSVEETFRYAVTVVNDEVSNDMSVDVPYSDGRTAVDIRLNWDMSEMAEDDIYYSTIDFGSSAVNAGNIGKVGLKLVRGANEISLDVPNTAAKRGDKVPFTFAVLPNNSGADRQFTIAATIPAGLKVTAADVLTSNSDIVTDIALDGDQLLISGMQPDTSDVVADYIVTTNLNDAMCRTPDFGNSNVGGYVNLAEFGIQPAFSGFAPVEYDANGRALNNKDNSVQHRNGVVVPMSALFNGYHDSFHLYNNTDELNVGKQNAVEIRGTGLISLWEGQPLFSPYHLRFPYNSFPYESVAPLWRSLGGGVGAALNQDQMSVPLDTLGQDRSGITLASTQTGWALIEFDNARSYGNPVRAADRTWSYTERDDRFDFQWIFNVNVNHQQGQYEMFYAYDNIDFGAQDGRGSIGIQGFRGQIYNRGPLGAYLAKDMAFNDVQDKIADGLVYCFDYNGPESSQFEVTVWGEVGANAAGTDLVFSAVSQVEGMADIAMSHSLRAPSNITVGGIANHEVAENAVLQDIAVYYVDEENSVNTISVSGDNITAQVSGHESGSTITITPKANFHGEVLVTVTVADVENPADAASTQFSLTVVSDGKEPVVVTPPVAKPVAKSSGGSFGIWMLSVFGLLMFRKRASR
ncbi:S8 family serine peptidase [Rheinheimera maricola]|uniref:S8 family serine peptidase n=1 Tax=Rheinheimera maricola TaxID=2793282 RepID=UPI0019644011|nr:S8 family serine peptidase [Rheinheimera maricola]